MNTTSQFCQWLAPNSRVGGIEGVEPKSPGDREGYRVQRAAPAGGEDHHIHVDASQQDNRDDVTPYRDRCGQQKEPGAREEGDGRLNRRLEAEATHPCVHD